MPGVNVKGRALLDTVDSIRHRIGDASLDRLISSLDDAAQRMLRGRIVVSDWYPLDVMTALMKADVKTFDGGNESVIVGRTEAVIDKQLRGVYRIFVRIGSPESVIKRIAAIHENYFENVRVEREFLAERRAAVRYIGFERQHAIIEHAIIGFYRKALEISGARRVSARFTIPVGSGATAALEISWE